jgi:hypothetical protein
LGVIVKRGTKRWLVKIGDTVEKISGYKWPGIIVAVFKTIDGKVRIVVECTVPEVRGALHIYNPEQLTIIDPVAPDANVVNWLRGALGVQGDS